MLAAMSTWPYRGKPDNPGAWLATVARNKAFDRLRRENRETAFEEPPPDDTEGDDGLFRATVDDPELRLILLCCHERLNESERLTLTLKLVSGFTAKDLGEAFLANEAAIGQRLARIRKKLHGEGDNLANAPSRFEIAARLPTMLKVVYLMFSLGYAPRRGDQLIRRDILAEALRLAREIAVHDITASPEADALAALLCFQSSRLDAREDADGRVVLFADQDRGLWNRELIDEGMRYLEASKTARELSRYHVEAGIASLYALAKDETSCDWASILSLYQQLEAMTESPVVAVNACVARAMAGDPGHALAMLLALGDSTALNRYAPYHLALAETHRLLDDDVSARSSYEQALDCGVADPVQALIETRLASCL